MAPFWMYPVVPGVGLSRDLQQRQLLNPYHDSLERPLPQTLLAGLSSDKDEIDLETRIELWSGWLFLATV